MLNRYRLSVVLVLVTLIPALIFGSGIDQVLSRLGISIDSAQESVWQSIRYGYFSYPSGTALKLVPPAERAAIVNVIGSFARSYTESSDFATRYASFREEQKPEPPTMAPSADETKNAMKADFEKSIREMEANIATMPQELQATMQEVVATMKQQLKELDSPDNMLNDPSMDEALKENYELQLAEHQKELLAWEEEYPVDPKPFIRSRLEEFIKESEGVDYAAELKKNEYGRMIFVDPAYERKSGNWKLCYRAGKETVEAARSFAQGWLNDLGGK